MTNASRKSLAERSCRPSRLRSSGNVRGPSQRLQTPLAQLHFRNVFDAQNPVASCMIRSWVILLCHLRVLPCVREVAA